uniref:Uncharacterized protein n=1 Tax=mine drainage metagenome TaxID=410659 RepID=E6QB45_9ZZZZ
MGNNKMWGQMLRSEHRSAMRLHFAANHFIFYVAPKSLNQALLRLLWTLIVLTSYSEGKIQPQKNTRNLFM